MGKISIGAVDFMDQKAILISQVCKKIFSKSSENPFVFGVSGTPGSGKSTFSHDLKNELEDHYKKRVVMLSLDDFYKTKSQRIKMAQEIHPLFLQRGVPGTHDVDLLKNIFFKCCDLNFKNEISLPIFSKQNDDRLPQSLWQKIKTPFDVIIFEGWCVGAKPESVSEIKIAKTKWEKENDGNGLWRNHVNEFLLDYQIFFERIDLHVHLSVKNWQEVIENRKKQERLDNKGFPESGVCEFLERFYRIAKRLEEEVLFLDEIIKIKAQ